MDVLAVKFLLQGHVDVTFLLNEAPVILGHEVADDTGALVVLLLIFKLLGDGLLELSGRGGEATYFLKNVENMFF